MKEFFKNSFATIYYDSSLDALVLQYTNKVPNDEEFIAANQEVLKAFTQLNTRKFVVDVRKMGIISLKAQEWLLKNLMPSMINHLKGKIMFHAQLLDASEIMAKVSASNVKNKSSKELGVEIMQFTNEEEMRQHIKSVKN